MTTFDADEIRARVAKINARLEAQCRTVVFTLTCWPAMWVACDHMKPALRGTGGTPDEALDEFEVAIVAYEARGDALARTLGIAA